MSEPPLPPGPRGPGLISGAIAASRYLPGFFQDIAARYGDVACVAAGPLKVFLLSSPEYAKGLLVDHDRRFEKGRGERRFTRRLLGNGVLGSEGEFHRRQHELLVPLLHGEAIRRFARIVADRGERMQERWSEGLVVDVFDLLAETTMGVMVEVLFGPSVEQPEGRELRAALAAAVGALEHLPLPVMPGVERLPLPANRRFEKARLRLDSLLLGLVAERRAGNPAADDGDLLTSLVRARHEDDGSSMDERQVRDEAMAIFRGHKTTGTALSWTWYLLSRHPDVEATVLEEIDAALGDRLPTAEDLDRLTHCRRVVSEAMRLFPPAWMMARRAVEEHEAGGFVVPVGATAVTSSYVIHRDPRVHPDPRRFDPGRFEPERRAGWHPFAYFPFGGGPKGCLGDEFAPFEAVLLMATVGRRWRLRVAPGARVEPAAKATLKPRSGMRMTLERRA
jgi:cytochrome P450